MTVPPQAPAAMETVTTKGRLRWSILDRVRAIGAVISKTHASALHLISQDLGRFTARASANLCQRGVWPRAVHPRLSCPIHAVVTCIHLDGPGPGSPRGRLRVGFWQVVKSLETRLNSAGLCGPGPSCWPNPRRRTSLRCLPRLGPLGRACLEGRAGPRIRCLHAHLGSQETLRDRQ